MPSTRNRIRAALEGGGGVAARGVVHSRVGQPVTTPFASARLLEAPRLGTVPLGDPVPPPEGTGFLDGIQRFSVEGHFGITPVVRGYVAAAVLTRRAGRLASAVRLEEEFLAVGVQRLTARQSAALDDAGLAVYDTEVEARPHPLLDLQAAGHLVERRREALEREAAARFRRAAADAWLVVDGGVGGAAPGARTLGLIKSHETQFLDGPDLEVALTLPCGHRSTVFARTGPGGGEVLSWYVRLWPWTEQDLLHGLVRVERAAGPGVLDEVTAVSRWLFGERAPLATPDSRWDRLIYPVHEVETFLRAHAVGWA